MIIYRRTSILESPAQTLVNTVNCVGVMGKGLAQAFKERDPDMFEAYKRVCDKKLLEPGKLWLWRGTDSWVLNFPTKVHWKNPSRIEWVEAGLEKFVTSYEAQGITEVSFPRLGCGNGNLDWDDVRPLMERYLSELPIPVFIHDYTIDIGLPEHMENVARKLQSESMGDASFVSFATAVKRAVSISKSCMIEIDTDDKFFVNLSSEDVLEINYHDAKWYYDFEDLRGVWLKLQKGMVTEKEAGWSSRGAGKPLVSLLSVLPNVRPIQIQRAGGSGPEVAIELAPIDRTVAVAPAPAKQYEIAWH